MLSVGWDRPFVKLQLRQWQKALQSLQLFIGPSFLVLLRAAWGDILADMN